MIYGSDLSSQLSKLKEEGITIKLEDDGSFTSYQREGGFPEGPLSKVLTMPKESLFLYPVHSTQPEMSVHIMLRLSKPLIIKPSSKISAYAKMPVSAGVYVLEETPRILIDAFGNRPYKYALYGPAANGIICRFCRTEVFSEPPGVDLWNAVAKIVVENSSEDFHEVKSLVFPLSNTMIYVDALGRAYAEIIFFHISRDGLGAVSLEKMPPARDLRECPRQFDKAQEKVVKFLMEFGF